MQISIIKNYLILLYLDFKEGQSMSDKKILIVDDSSTVRKVAEQMIVKAGSSCFLAENGEMALNILSDNASSIVAAFIDYNMPNMTGIELVKKIKENPDFNHVKAVIVSSVSADNKELLDAAKIAGVSAWITKPLESETLNQLLESLGLI